MTTYLKSFVVASSWAATFPFFYTVGKLKQKNYSYYQYSLIAPLWLGAWNVVSLIAANYFGLSTHLRFFLLTLLTYSLSIIIVRTTKAYHYNSQQWRDYYLRLFLKHFLLWNVIVFYLEKYI